MINNKISKKTYISDPPIQELQSIIIQEKEQNNIYNLPILNPSSIILSQCQLYNLISNFNGNAINVVANGSISGKISEINFIFDNCLALTFTVGQTIINVASSQITPVIVKLLYFNGKILVI